MSTDLYTYLSSRTYPGRGIAVGRTPCGKKMRIAYFIMGRSENSRNRIFVKDGEGIRTEAYDPSKLEDPSLIIYAPVRVWNDKTIVTNGDQTDTIYEGYALGKDFVESLRTRTFEPDAPNYTPRISAVVEKDSLQMSILKSDENSSSSTLRFFYEYSHIQNGTGRVIHTYVDDGSPIPSFTGEPVKWDMVKEPFDMWSKHVWEALNTDNKVSLFTRQITIETGESETLLFNKKEGQ